VNELPVRNEHIAVLEQPAQANGLETIEKTAEEIVSSKAQLIRALADKGKLPEALALCEEALSSDKLNPGMHYLRATILQELNRIEEAIGFLETDALSGPEFFSWRTLRWETLCCVKVKPRRQKSISRMCL